MTRFAEPFPDDDGQHSDAVQCKAEPMTAQAVGWTQQAASVHAAGVRWLAITALLLFTAPKLSVKFGPLPIYAIDFPAVMALTCAVMLPPQVAPPPRFLGFVSILSVFVVIGELAAIVYFGKVLEPVYALGRMLIAISLFYSAAQLIRTAGDLKPILMAAAIGIIVTSSMMIFSSLPPTRGIAESVLTIRFLEPAGAGMPAYLSSAGDEGLRGRSLIGVSILSGVFINVMLPFALVLLRWPRLPWYWRIVTLMGLAIAPMGVLVSWSRTAILGLLLAVGALVALGAGKMRGPVIAGAALTGGLILWIGLDSELLMVERIEQRTVAAVTNPYEDEREWERILSYVEPFAHLGQNPQFLVVGEGSISERLSRHAEIRGKASHAVFAKGYYSYGLVAALMYAWIPFMMLRYVLRLRNWLANDTFLKQYATVLLVVTLALMPCFLFDHAAISAPRVAMLAFLALGLMSSLRNLRTLSASDELERNVSVFDRDDGFEEVRQ